MLIDAIKTELTQSILRQYCSCFTMNLLGQQEHVQTQQANPRVTQYFSEHNHEPAQVTVSQLYSLGVWQPSQSLDTNILHGPCILQHGRHGDYLCEMSHVCPGLLR